VDIKTGAVLSRFVTDLNFSVTKASQSVPEAKPSKIAFLPLLRGKVLKKQQLWRVLAVAWPAAKMENRTMNGLNPAVTSLLLAPCVNDCINVM
jgi:hypothetical protein